MLPDLASALTAVGVSGWLVLIVYLCCLIDGFFPPVPSETVVMGALTLAFSAHASPWVIGGIIAASALGAASGDRIAYAIGCRIGTDRWAWMRRPKVRAALDWAGSQVRSRPASLILGARYIPIGRVAVNVTAGASGMPYRRFAPLSVFAGLLWTLMCWALSTLVSAWLGHQPLLAMVVAVTVSIVLGLAVDALSRLVRRRTSAVPASITRVSSSPDDRDAAGDPWCQDASGVVGRR